MILQHSTLTVLISLLFLQISCSTLPPKDPQVRCPAAAAQATLARSIEFRFSCHTFLSEPHEGPVPDFKKTTILVDDMEEQTLRSISVAQFKSSSNGLELVKSRKAPDLTIEKSSNGALLYYNRMSKPLSISGWTIPANGVGVSIDYTSLQKPRVRTSSLKRSLGEFFPEHGKNLSDMLKERLRERPSPAAVTIAELNMLELASFPYIPERVIGQGEEALYVKTTSGLAVRISRAQISPRREFDIPFLDFGYITNGRETLAYSVHERITHLSLQEIADFESKELVPRGYELTDWKPSQVGRLPNGRVVLLDFNSVTQSKKPRSFGEKMVQLQKLRANYDLATKEKNFFAILRLQGELNTLRSFCLDQTAPPLLKADFNSTFRKLNPNPQPP